MLSVFASPYWSTLACVPLALRSARAGCSKLSWCWWVAGQRGAARSTLRSTRYGLPSHLASVQNADENAQVLELCQASDFGVQKCWLGFSSSAADNASAPWAWDDQAEVGYTNWDSYDGILGTLAEPLPLSLNSGNTAGAIMQAADLGAVRNEGKWAAEDPSSRRPFVCMERYVSPPSPSPPPPPDLPGARTFFGLRLELTVRIPPSYP